KRAALRELRTYLENNRGRRDYPRYRALGLPIGSGQVEAQCKSRVGARCKLAGMRNWTYAGAEGVLRLRAAVQDGSYAELWRRRLGPAAGGATIRHPSAAAPGQSRHGKFPFAADGYKVYRFGASTQDHEPTAGSPPWRGRGADPAPPNGLCARYE